MKFKALNPFTLKTISPNHAIPILKNTYQLFEHSTMRGRKKKKRKEKKNVLLGLTHHFQ